MLEGEGRETLLIEKVGRNGWIGMDCWIAWGGTGGLLDGEGQEGLP